MPETPAIDAESAEEPTRRNTPPVGPKARASNKAVVEQRVTAVFVLVVSGLQTWEVRRSVAKQQARERRKRDEARAAAVTRGDDDPDAAAVLAVPIVWGPEPIPDRTLDRYIARARTLLEDQAAQFAGQRNRELAAQKTRLDNLFRAAVKNGKLYAALKASELMIELFGLKEHARALQLATTTEDGRADGPTLLPTDPQARLAAFGNLMAEAVKASPDLRTELSALAPRTPVMP